MITGRYVMNIYMIEKTMEYEIAHRREVADQLRQLDSAKRTDKAEATRTLLQAGRLIIAWTVR